MIESQRRLIKKVVEAGPKLWAPLKLPEPKVVDDLPKILFWMYGHDSDPEARKARYFNKGVLNPAGGLISFTQRAVEAANYFNLGLRGEGGRRLVVMLFPHETTNLRRWVEDPAAHYNLPGTRIFMTDQKINRYDTLITEYTRIMNADKNIQAEQYPGAKKEAELPPEKQTREFIMKRFNITPEYQEEMLQLFI